MDRSSVRLGNIAGVPVGVSWTLLVLAAVFSVGLAEGRLPASDPGYSPTTYWLAALVTVAGFVASILAHELGHAIVARRQGFEVEGVTLWMLGGVARYRGETDRPQAELGVAAVGPLTSLLVGAVFGGAAWLVDLLGIDPLASSVLRWLAVVNVVLAVFNALPAAPLDGGHVLAALIWWRTGDRHKGHLRAAAAGRYLGFALIAAGAWQLLSVGTDLGLWTLFIGWYVLQSAQAEAQGARARAALAGIPVVEAARPDPPIVDEWLTVDGLVAVLGDGGDHTAFVVRESDGVLRSVVTLDDIRRVPPARRGEVALGDIAVPIAELTTAWSTESLLDVLQRVDPDGRPEIVVYDSRMCLVGVVSRTDLSRLARRGGQSPPPPPPPRRSSPAR
ncbi:site-2 protease family protein [Actinomarinicola tropica]|uniref:Zinc metalloprotease n=1 Tax=Actinomarinicola tropica TaxID=2789776 RepID=A0A5Q2RNX2_9ACTN|nr:site-2 protease family protein [Actinomarinicola tropica]QGG96126.1 site-2 protease family protein [Actinomarinicola tropica]